MTIHPETLKARRQANGMSQEVLATKSKVSKKTITRIESGKADVRKVRPTIVARLAQALGMKSDELGIPPGKDDEDDKYFKDMGYRKLRAHLDGKTVLAYALVNRRYKVSPQTIIEMAPLFFTLLAEGSLAWRREKLAQIREAEARLIGLASGHLSFAQGTYQVEEGADAEENSINSRDLFGKKVANGMFDFGYDVSKSNPFVDYLETLAGKIAPEIAELDPTGDGSLKVGDEMPEYSVCWGEFERVTGGDYWAQLALERGYVRLAEIPDGLMDDAKSAERVDWLHSRIPKDVLEESQRMADDFSSSLGGSGA